MRTSRPRRAATAAAVSRQRRSGELTIAWIVPRAARASATPLGLVAGRRPRAPGRCRRCPRSASAGSAGSRRGAAGRRWRAGRGPRAPDQLRAAHLRRRRRCRACRRRRSRADRAPRPARAVDVGRRPLLAALARVHRLVGEPVRVLVLLARDPLVRHLRGAGKTRAASAASGFMSGCLIFQRPDICSTTSLESIRTWTVARRVQLAGRAQAGDQTPVLGDVVRRDADVLGRLAPASRPWPRR